MVAEKAAGAHGAKEWRFFLYAPQSDGFWFPSTFSTEFKIRVLFFLPPEILVDAQNPDFEKMHV